MIELFDYQQRIVELVHSCNTPRPLVVMAPGAGKTITGLSCVRHRPRIIWTAHRQELLKQAEVTAAKLGISILTLTIQGLLNMPVKPEGYLVFDEAHHATSEEWSTVTSAYPKILGLTATPERADGTGLGSIFTSIFVGATFKELIAMGRLCPIEVIAPSKLLKPGTVAQHPLDAYKQHTPDSKAILFAPNVASAIQYAVDFKNAGIPAAYIHGTMGARERERVIEDYKSGKYKVLTNALILTEGFDDPETSTVIIARGCSTAGTWIQTTMRCGRVFAGKEKGTVLDLRGVSHIHGDPTEDRVYSLEGRGIRRKADKSDTRYCSVCGAIVLGNSCEECGFINQAPLPPKITGSKLEKRVYLPNATHDERTKKLASLITRQRANGYNAKWPYVQHKILFGYWPTKADIEKARKLC